jgi:hypothetical protein
MLANVDIYQIFPDIFVDKPLSGGSTKRSFFDVLMTAAVTFSA